MQYPDALGIENTVEIVILRAKPGANFTGAVVPYARGAQSAAGIGDIELMAVSPRPALRYIGTFIAYIACAQLLLYKISDRAALDKARGILFQATRRR